MLLDEMNDDRRKMLDEIRLRAEKAEIERIEAQEVQFKDHLSEIVSDNTRPSSSQNNFSLGQKIQELREQLLGTLDPNHAEENTHEEHEPVLHNRGGLNLDEGSEEHETQVLQINDRIAELLHAANAYYQEEKYHKSLELLKEALTVDPENQSVLALKLDVQKAKDLTDRLKEDKVRRKIQQSETEKQVFIPLHKKVVDQSLVPAEEHSSEAELPVSVQPLPEPKRALSTKRDVRRPLKWFALITLALFGVATTYIVFQNVRDEFFFPKKSILVLPVRSLNESVYLAEGLTEDLITHLSHIRGLNVVGAKSAMALGSTGLSEAARSVNAEYFLQWDVEEAGNTLRTRLNLVNAATSTSVFNQQFEVSRDRVGEFLYDFIPGLVNAMEVEERNSKSTSVILTTNGNAFEAYLQARYLIRHPELASLDSAIALLDFCRKQDPEFPAAETALGWIHILRYDASRETTQTDLDEAHKNFLRAVSLGAKNAEVYRLWGAIEYHRSNFGNAVERFQQAITAAPSDAEAYRRLSIVYLRTHRGDEALDAARLAASLDPLNPLFRQHLAMILTAQKRDAEALKELEKDLKNGRPSEYASWEGVLGSLVANNHHERAIDILRERAETSPRDFVVFYELGRVLQLAGKPPSVWSEAFQQSLRIIDDTLKVSPRLAIAYSYRGLAQTRLGHFSEGYASSARARVLAPEDVTILYNSARVFALQRSKAAEALEYLTKAVDRRFVLENLLDLDLTNLHQEPRFKAILGG